ncbi:hypothetical protein PCE1_001648 [Barthelona sp. PCE]
MNYLIFIIVIALVATGCLGFDVTECSSTEYFDVASLNCVSCGTNQRATNDGLSCECFPGNYTTSVPGASTPATRITCTACGSGNGTDSSGYTCASCDSGSGASLDSTLQTCMCADAGKYVDYSTGVGVCQDCPSGTGSRADKPWQCLKCGPRLSYSSSSKTCECATGYQLVTLNSAVFPVEVSDNQQNPHYYTIDDANRGFTCVEQTVLSAFLSQYPSYNKVDMRKVYSTSTDTYKTVTLTSALLTSMLPTAAVRCRQENDARMCQVLGNLCALVYFDKTHAACKYYDLVYQEHMAVTNDRSDWPELLPFLYYDNALATTISTEIEQKYVFNTADTSDLDSFEDRIDLIVAKYALNGSFVGFEPVGPQIHSCVRTNTEAAQWQAFGVSQTKQCQLDLSGAMLEQHFFYDIYIRDIDPTFDGTSDGPVSLVPVPVRVKNLRSSSGEYVNQNSDDSQLSVSDDIFTRRLWTFDHTLPRDDLGQDSSYCRYMKNMKLSITLQVSTQSRIYPPIITVDYEEGACTSYNSGNDRIMPRIRAAAAQFRSNMFEVVYSMNLDSMWTTVNVFFWSVLVMVLIFLFIRMYFFNRQHEAKFHGVQGTMSPQTHSSNSVLFFFRQMSIVGSTAFFIFSAILSIYFVLFFKFQDTVYMLLPTDYSQFYFIAGVSFVFQILAIFIDLILVSKTRINTIDWEYSNEEADENDKRMSTGIDESSGDVKTNVWRKLYVLNQYRKLQAKTPYHRYLVMMTIYLLFDKFGISDTAAPFPSNNASVFADDDTLDSMHPLLLLGVIAFWYITVSVVVFVVVRIFNAYVFDPYYHFIDSTTLSNMSLLISNPMIDTLYLHGKNPSGHSDVSMYRVLDGLNREEKALVAGRALKVRGQGQMMGDEKTISKANTQVFRLFIPIDLQLKINRALVNDKDYSMSKIGQIEQKEVDFTKELKTLLNSVEEGQIGSIVKNQTLVQKVFGFIPEFGNVSQTGEEDLSKRRNFVFLNLSDRQIQHSFFFQNSLWRSVIFEIMFIYIFWLFLENFFYSVFFTALICFFQGIIRNLLIKNAMSKYSFMDMRFLD